jgi:AbrB family looped-hinge helix DNA binding protein
MVERSKFEMRVGRRGQITLPIEIRERLGVVSGGKIKFVLLGNQVELRSADLSVTRLQGVLGKPGKRVGLKQMDEAVTNSTVGRFRQKSK